MLLLTRPRLITASSSRPRPHSWGIAALRATRAKLDGLLKALAEEIKSSTAKDCHRRIHLLVGCPAPIQAAAIMLEFVDALADRLISRRSLALMRPWCVEYCRNESAAAP